MRGINLHATILELPVTRQPPCSRDLLHPVARPWRAVELPWGRAEGTTSELLRGGSPDLQCRHRGGKLRKAYDGAPPRPARLRSLGGFQQAPWVTPKATPAGESRGYFSVPSIYFHGNVNCSTETGFHLVPVPPCSPQYIKSNYWAYWEFRGFDQMAPIFHLFFLLLLLQQDVTMDSSNSKASSILLQPHMSFY